MEERVVWEGKPEWSGYVLPFIGIGFCGLLGIITLTSGGIMLLLLGCFFFLILYLSRKQHHFKVTNCRLIVNYGLFAKKISEVDIKDIRNIIIKQRVIERMLGLGSIEFTTAAGPIKEITIFHIKNPEELKDKIKMFK